MSWTKLVGSSRSEVATALTVGADGFVFVGGFTTEYPRPNGETVTSVSGFMAKHAPDGTKVWYEALRTTGVVEVLALTTGIDGTLYVAGYCAESNALDDQTSHGGADAFLIKYSADGTKVWTRLLGSAGRETAYALTTAADGAIYVAGSTASHSIDAQTNNGSVDAFLSQYTADGVQNWIKLFGSTGEEEAYALTTGADGAIYVAGSTTSRSVAGQLNNGWEGSGDAFVSKYARDGTHAWTRLFGSTGDERACALTTGVDGAIYLAGRSSSNAVGEQTNNGSWDAFLAKYTEDGTQTWVRLFGSSDDDQAVALAHGADGAVFVGGYTQSAALDGQVVSGSTDFFLRKYTSAGENVWTRLFGSSGDDVLYAMTAGADGALYFAGSTDSRVLDGQINGGEVAAFLINFADPDRLDTTAPQVSTCSPLDAATGVAIGSNLVLSFSEAILRGTGDIEIHQDSATGQLIETFDAATSARLTISGSTLEIDLTNDLTNGTQYFVTLGAGSINDLAGNRCASSSAYDFTTVPAPIISWSKIFGSTGAESNNAIAPGPDGSIYLGGYTLSGSLNRQTNSGMSDGFLSKYAMDGSTVWTRLLGDAGAEAINGITFFGGLYVTGSTSSRYLEYQTNKGGSDAFLTKYSDDGTKAWTRILGSKGQEAASAIAFSNEGYIYFTGSTTSVSLDGQANNSWTGFEDAFLCKYSLDGGKVWTRLIGSAFDEVATALTIGVDGAIYLTGTTSSATLDGRANNGGIDLFLTKYTPTGNKVWTRLFGSTGADVPYALTAGPDGAVYMAGYTTSSSLDGQINGGSWDAFLTKYTQDGSPVWTRLIGSTGQEIAHAATSDPDGYIYVCGSTTSTSLDGQVNQSIPGNEDAFLTKYSPDGTKISTKLLGSAGAEIANALTIGTDGAVYISGNTWSPTLNGQTSNGDGDAFLMRVIYDSTAPMATTFLPANDAGGVAVDMSITIWFSEDVARGDGEIQIHQGASTGPVIETFDAATSPRITVWGSGLDIDPSNDLANATQYFITLAPGAIKDLSGNSYAGTSTYQFTTAADTIAPRVQTFNPGNGETEVPVDSNIVLEFNEIIARGSGAIEIRQGSITGTAIETFDAATSARLALGGSRLTIDPSNNLAHNTRYFLAPASGQIKDLAGNSWFETSTYTFTTAADTTDTVPPKIAITTNKTSLKLGEKALLTFTLSESTTDFTIDDIACSGGTLNNFSGLGTTYSAIFTPDENSTKNGVLSVQSYTFSDSGGNANVDGSETDNQLILNINTTTVSMSVRAYDWKSHTAFVNPTIKIDTKTTGTPNTDHFVVAEGLAPGRYGLDISVSTVPGSDNSAITLKDALAALKLAIGIDKINSSSAGASVGASSYQRAAADFNGDGKVDLKDALEILKYSIGVTTANTPNWLFYDETEKIVVGGAPITEFSQPGNTVSVTSDRVINLVGVLTGDVDGSWTPPAGSTALDLQHFTALVASLQAANDTDVSLVRWGIYG